VERDATRPRDELERGILIADEIFTGEVPLGSEDTHQEDWSSQAPRIYMSLTDLEASLHRAVDLPSTVQDHSAGDESSSFAGATDTHLCMQRVRRWKIRFRTKRMMMKLSSINKLMNLLHRKCKLPNLLNRNH
jgi:hypothetical protein